MKNGILAQVINYKRNRSNYTPEERAHMKKKLRDGIRIDLESFKDALDQINNL